MANRAQAEREKNRQIDTEKKNAMYDFVTHVDRRNAGSSKWQGMFSLKKDIPANIIPFSVADMELKNPPEILEGLKEFLTDAILGYSVATESYRTAVCDWMKTRHNWNIAPEWIVECDGVIPALYAAVNAFTDPGDGVILLTPVYYPFYSAVEQTGRKVAGCDLINTGGAYSIDYDSLSTLAKDSKNKLMIFCSPHNPVGKVWKKEDLETVGNICLENDVQLLSDEIHFDLILPGHRHTVLATVSEELQDRVVICTAPSKTFNLAGLHASNIIIKNSSIRRRFCAALAKTGFFSLNILGYKACEIAYQQCEHWLDELLLLLDGNRALVEEYMKKNIPLIKPYSLEGTYLQWWDCRALGMDHKQLESFMINDALLFLDEGYIFGKAGEGFERINLACPREKLFEALERLHGAVKRKGII